VARTTVTDAEGRYRFPALPPGSYTLKAELSGFAAEERHVAHAVRVKAGHGHARVLPDLGHLARQGRGRHPHHHLPFRGECVHDARLRVAAVADGDEGAVAGALHDARRGLDDGSAVGRRGRRGLLPGDGQR
jgi:hypothetical protein